MLGKKAIIAGATGSVGRLVVKTCVEDPRIANVVAIVRKTIPSDKAVELWGMSGSSSNTKKLSQIQVDYSALDVKDTKLQEAFEGADAFMTALGLYSGKATEAEMDLVEGQYNQILASMVRDGGAKRGAYLSGQGVMQPTREGRAMAMFGRAKGRAEEGLAAVFEGGAEEAHVSVRPGGIFDRPGEPAYGYFLETLVMNQWPMNKLKETRFGISAPDIAKGMVQGTLFDDSEIVVGNTMWENEAIKEAARRYESNLQ